PGVDGEAGRLDRALVERQLPVDQLVHVDVGDVAQSLAGRAHALRGVEAEGVGGADVRGGDAAEHQPQHRVRVGGGADGGAGVGAHPFLVDDDGRAQVVQGVDVGAVQRRHEALDERRVGLVDQPPGLGGDGVEDQRRLAGAGHAGEHAQPPLRDVERDPGQVVLAGAAYLDVVVTVGGAVVGGAQILGDGHGIKSVIEVPGGRFCGEWPGWAAITLKSDVAPDVEGGVCRLRPIDLARIAGLSTQQIRNYADSGILPPTPRTPAGYRRFGVRHREALLTYRVVTARNGWSAASVSMQAVHAGDVQWVVAHVEAGHVGMADEWEALGAPGGGLEQVSEGRDAVASGELGSGEV